MIFDKNKKQKKRNIVNDDTDLNDDSHAGFQDSEQPRSGKKLKLPKWKAK